MVTTSTCFRVGVPILRVVHQTSQESVPGCATFQVFADFSQMPRTQYVVIQSRNDQARAYDVGHLVLPYVVAHGNPCRVFPKVILSVGHCNQ